MHEGPQPPVVDLGIAAYLQHARALAAALAGVPGVTVVPDPPQVPMMHLLLAVTSDGYAASARQLAEERGIWIPPASMTTTDPAVQRIELSVGDATMQFEPGEVAEIFRMIIASADTAGAADAANAADAAG